MDDEFFNKWWILTGTVVNAVTNVTSLLVTVSRYTENGSSVFSAKTADGTFVESTEIMKVDLVGEKNNEMVCWRAFMLDRPESRRALTIAMTKPDYTMLLAVMHPVPFDHPNEKELPGDDYQWLGDGWYRK